ncbi:PREDICTED: F-box protein At2g14290-like [Camelina sativa]|uniref:F-box protein At2g14290-like n=1 Tax=Camelina sativa TaxID=90675 RepID=A0ABM0W8I1_CAMSA|nr:PREDICTED: F-box protein At2g14290-like [Camelina sativa]
MGTQTPRTWSELPPDLLESIYNRLSFTDFHRAKLVCWNWNLSSKLTVPKKIRSPWLLLFPEDDEDEDGSGSVLLFNPEEEERTYRTKRDFSGTRFLANSGKWFLVIDSRFNLYIIDVFSDTRIDLPHLEESLLDKEESEDLRGLLWVDEKTAEYVVVLFFNFPSGNVGFCKKGDDHYTKIPLHRGVPWRLEGLNDAVLLGYRLYIRTQLSYIRILDLSKQQGSEDVNKFEPFQLFFSTQDCSIAVTTRGEVLLVKSILDNTNIVRFSIFKDIDYNPQEEVDSLGDEALLLDLGIPVPSIAPNSIYFTRHGRIYRKEHLNLDICVFNLETKTLKRFSRLSSRNLKDARWFLPTT